MPSNIISTKFSKDAANQKRLGNTGVGEINAFDGKQYFQLSSFHNEKAMGD